MFERSRRLLAILAIFGAATLVRSENPMNSEAPQTTPKGLPIELTIVDKAVEAYELNTLGDPIFQYQEAIRLGEKNGELLPAAKVEMELEIKNTGSTPVKIWVGGDGTEWTFDLKGNGAMEAQQKTEQRKKAVAPTEVTIQPGKSHKISLTDLEYGPANRPKRAYITETELYTLTATFRTAISPAPKDSLPVKGTNFGEIKLQSAPRTFRVVRPS